MAFVDRWSLKQVLTVFEMCIYQFDSSRMQDGLLVSQVVDHTADKLLAEQRPQLFGFAQRNCSFQQRECQVLCFVFGGAQSIYVQTSYINW